MPLPLWKRLAAARTRIEELETQRTEALRSLPAELGFPSMSDLIAALHAAEKREAGSGGRDDRGAGRRRKQRTSITAEIRAKVIALAKQRRPKVTAREIAETTGVSAASVALIKRDAGLTRHR